MANVGLARFLTSSRMLIKSSTDGNYGSYKREAEAEAAPEAAAEAAPEN
jgi:hypothetical protein